LIVAHDIKDYGDIGIIHQGLRYIMVSEAQVENVQENILPLHGRELVNQFGA
jgi:hypothetical protein